MTTRSVFQRMGVAVVALTVLALWSPVPASATPLIFNGGFEAAFAGWSVFDQAGGSGSWFIDDADGSTPLSGMPTVGPAAGAAYAVTDQSGPGAHVLLQPFTVPGVGTTILTFMMFANDWDAGPIVDPCGLDYTCVPNQHARVDILSAAAGPFDTGAGVLANFYLGVDGGADPNPYTLYVFDITGIVGAGGTFQLRFAEVDNQFFFNMGVDEVGIEFTAAVPEPGTLALLASGLFGLGFAARRKTA